MPPACLGGTGVAILSFRFLLPVDPSGRFRSVLIAIAHDLNVMATTGCHPRRSGRCLDAALWLHSNAHGGFPLGGALFLESTLSTAARIQEEYGPLRWSLLASEMRGWAICV